MDIRREEKNNQSESVSDISLDCVHNRSVRRQSISVNGNGTREKRDNSMQEERISPKSRLENVSDASFESVHISSVKRQSISLNENGTRENFMQEERVGRKSCLESVTNASFESVRISSVKRQSKSINENETHEKRKNSMQEERISRISYLESVTNASFESVHISSVKRQSISINEKGTREKKENSMQEERISRKSEQIGNLDNEKSSSFSVKIPLERNIGLRNKKRYKKRYFCCGSLADGAIASANYTNVISVILILFSLHVFFSDSKDDEGMNKALAFTAIIFAVCYIRSSTNLKRAINEEQREKIIPWILFTILTIFFLLSKAIYVSVTYWEELDDFDEDLTVPCLRLILIAFLAFVGCTLIYCTYGVIRLFKSMAGSEVPAHSLMTDIRAFINGVSA